MVNTVKHFLIILKKPATDALKTSSKRVIQKIAQTTGDLIGNKITGVSKNHNKIIQRQLQMMVIKKNLKKDLHLQNKGKNLLII